MASREHCFVVIIKEGGGREAKALMKANAQSVHVPYQQQCCYENGIREYYMPKIGRTRTKQPPDAGS